MTVEGSALDLVLSRIELHEAELLSWGIVDATLNDAELEQLLTGVAGADVQELRAELLERGLVVQTPSGGFRSRMAETLRLLSTLRQTFPNQRWWEGPSLVLDYRFVHRARARPRRDRSRAAAAAHLHEWLGEPGRRSFEAMAPDQLSGFQERAARAVLDALSGGRDAGVMISAGTGSGKTYGFYLPALSWIADAIAAGPDDWVKALAVYPRGELLKDQVRAVLRLTRTLHEADPGPRPIRVGTWFGLTPRAGHWITRGWAGEWTRQRGPGGQTGWVCPFLRCLGCDGPLTWMERDLQAGRERLTCADASCGDVVDERFITLTRERAASAPPDVVFTTSESLNRQLAATDQHTAFGLRRRRLAMVLLDEVHTYEGVSGAQNALLLRRLRHAVGRPFLRVGLSATLRNAESFFASLTGLYADRVTVVEPAPDELEHVSAEYLVALRHDPSSLTGPLSTSIQAAMALTRCLDARGTPYAPPPSSEGFFGRKTFVFTDKLDVTNRLYWDLLDAEGWWREGAPKTRPVLTLAHLRSEGQPRRRSIPPEPAAERDPAGQWWWLPEQLGRDLDGDEQLLVSRTSSQDLGVDPAAEVIVATATLEVGYDDDEVGAVLQHKAPHDAARFLQRKGRAGRDLSMRPWTVVVLSDWGRDQLAWQLYDQLFDPVLEPRYLPLQNRYVLKMQAVYATLDWLSGRLDGVGQDRSTWTDLCGPASVVETNDDRKEKRARRQAKAAEVLKDVLVGGPARDHLRDYLRLALGFPDDDLGRAELDALCWAPPRSLFQAVIPTMHRRLVSAWEGEVPDRGSQQVRTRTPLPEFVAGNLFDDLLTPDVEVLVPRQQREGEYEPNPLPAIRTIREFAPGNVTRHFGVRSASRRHWVPLPEGLAGPIDVEAVYGGRYVTTIPASSTGRPAIDLYRPTRLTVAVPPDSVRDATSASPEWQVHAEPLAAGHTIDMPQGRWREVLPVIEIHSHASGNGVRVRRFATGARGRLVRTGAPEPFRLEFGTTQQAPGRMVALGVELDVDGLCLHVAVPPPVGAPSPGERAERMATVLADDSDLPEGLSWFQRVALTSALLVVLAELTDGPRAIERVADADLGSSLVGALERLALLTARDADAADREGASIDDDQRGSGPRDQAMRRWCTEPEVLVVVRRAARCAWADRDASWLQWRHRRFAASMGALFVEAAGRVCPELDSSDLAIDVDPGEKGADDGTVEVWITELAPGGNGQLEAIHRTIAEDRSRFARFLDAAVQPGELERLDSELVGFLDALAEDQALADVCATLRRSWPEGHTEVDQAFAAVRREAERAAAPVGRTAWTTIASRLLGPGADPGLPRAIRSLLRRWDDVERRVGVELDARALGAVCHDDPAYDQALRLPADTTSARRALAIASFFWPRGRLARNVELDAANPFGLLPPVDRGLVREALGPRCARVMVAAWDAETRAHVHRLLVETGQVDLVFDPNGGRLARAVVMDLQADPVDAGAVFSHPDVVGITPSRAGLTVTLELPEALT